MCKEDNDNAEQNANNCRNCGSIEEEEGDTHIHCADCGIPKDALADDDGFVPTNPNQTPYQHKSLGSFVGSKSDREIRHDRSMRRLSNLNGRVAHKKPTFLDGVLLELSRTPAPNYLHSAATDIVRNADSEQALSSMRHSLRGLPGSRDEDRQYRQRLFAVASLELLQDAGYEAPIAILMKEWNIDRFDLKKVKSRLRRLVSGKIPCLSNSETDPTTARRSAMLDHLSTFRDHLAEQESITSASEVFGTSKKIASSWGEPIEIDDDWVLDLRYTNSPETAVAGKAFMEAMHRHGFSRESILELHGRYPVLTLDTFIIKKGWEGRTDDVTEEA
tara:strand:+ start:316 stop:1311 length:996 start_codon:yes stop_codon:yes gene_type:complete